DRTAEYVALGVATSTRRLVAVRVQRIQDLWVAPRGKPEAARQIVPPSWGFLGVSWIDKARLVTVTPVSPVSGAPALRIVATDGKITVLEEEDGTLRGARACGDHYVVCLSNRLGVDKVWRIGSDGRNPKQMTYGPWTDGQPVCTADGRSIVF